MQEETKKENQSLIISILFGVLLAFLCRTLLFSPTHVHGESMYPTIQDEDKVLISKCSDIERFDIIVFQAPDSDENYIKRVIGLPGDQIKMENDILYINGKGYIEEYLSENKENNVPDQLTCDFTLEEITGETNVPDDLLFVMGDNRLVSKDSRAFGFIPYESILGEVKLRYYPLRELEIVN